MRNHVYVELIATGEVGGRAGGESPKVSDRQLGRRQRPLPKAASR